MLIRNAVDSFDNSTEQGNLQREAVQVLAALGESKASTFKLEIEEALLSAGQGTNFTIPVTSITRQLSDVRAYSASEVGNIGDAVSGALSAFLSGSQEEIIDGVGNLMTNTLTFFLGSASASQGTTEEYYIATEGTSVVRIDMKAFYRNVQSESIRSQVERITAVVAVKSVVDIGRLDFSTFNNLYQAQLSASGLSQGDIGAAIEAARDIYDSFIAASSSDPRLPQADSVLDIRVPPAALNLQR